MGRKRAPLITVPSDDFTIDVDGEEYHPHEGEVVTFKRRVSSRDLMIIAQASELREEDSTGADMARFFYDEACAVLSRAIFSWTWTDMYDDSPLGKPLSEDAEERQPSMEDMRGLDAMSELQYLLEKWLDSTAGGEKN